MSPPTQRAPLPKLSGAVQFALVSRELGVDITTIAKELLVELVDMFCVEREKVVKTLVLGKKNAQNLVPYLRAVLQKGVQDNLMDYQSTTKVREILARVEAQANLIMAPDPVVWVADNRQLARDALGVSSSDTQRLFEAARTKHKQLRESIKPVMRLFEEFGIVNEKFAWWRP